MSIDEKRSDYHIRKKEHDSHLDSLGFQRFKKDKRDTEEYIEKVQNKELELARESFIKLHASMQATDMKQQQQIDAFNNSVEESKKTLQAIKRDIKDKEEFQNRTLEKVKEKCQNMFQVQQENYGKYNEIMDERLNNHSKKVMDKYNST